MTTTFKILIVILIFYGGFRFYTLFLYQQLREHLIPAFVVSFLYLHICLGFTYTIPLRLTF